ncbi:MAG: hypothetical protein AB8I08_31900 [Sandaracinaceae bacterium]
MRRRVRTGDIALPQDASGRVGCIAGGCTLADWETDATGFTCAEEGVIGRPLRGALSWRRRVRPGLECGDCCSDLTGGRALTQMMPGAPSDSSTTRNGVTTMDLASYSCSYQFDS